MCFTMRHRRRDELKCLMSRDMEHDAFQRGDSTSTQKQWYVETKSSANIAETDVIQ